MKTHLTFFNREVIRKSNMTIVKQHAAIRLDKIPALQMAFSNIPIVNLFIKTSKHFAQDKDGTIYLVFTGKGISKCNKGDVYNEKVGFNIADTRAQKSVFKLAERFFNNVIELIEKYVYNDIVDISSIFTDSIYACEDHERDILDEYAAEPILQNKFASKKLKA